ncbi:cytochrome P450 78A9-like [Curcuma longa]|uniref:cytochrome P450 78A9-like n=1 Tax=Curcuma longa TaxID=136217 RepID=UPI003D9F1493
MDSIVESRWIVLLSIAAKCDELTASRAHLLPVAAAVAACWLAILLLHWACPGGPAWGRYYWRSLRRTCGVRHAIPGPRGLPVFGSMGLMSGLKHRKLAAAAAAIPGARRLMAFSLGETRAVVTCDPDVARDILNSPAFADRPASESAYGLLFHRSIGFAPYGDYWRALRRISAAHLFSPKQVAAFAGHRAAIADQMVRALRGRAAARSPIQVRSVLKQAALNHVMWFAFGKQYDVEEDTKETRELRSLVEEGYDLLGKLNWSDHLPAIAGLDLQRVRARSSKLVVRVERFVTRIIEEHRVARAGDSVDSPRDFVDVLLSLQEPENLSDADMVAVLWEMIFRGTDTVAVTIEWVLSRLVMHGEVQARLQAELDAAAQAKMAVPYLQAVIKETLRVHPPGPLMSWARMAMEDVSVGGSIVPAGTTAMVNMWAIARDPTVWRNPLRFDPDRFLGPAAEFSVMGADLRLAPFGAGRRGCPGKGLAMATVELWVATLAREFEWLPVSAEGGVDQSEVLRLSCEMAAPLTVKLRHRRQPETTLP